MASKKRKPNIVLITFDTARADHMGFMGYDKNITPFLDSLAENGVFFSYAFSTSTDTTQSFPAIMTSTYPLDYGGYRKIEPPRVMVGEPLQKAGYYTMGFHSVAYLSSYFGYNKGWNEFRFFDHFSEKDMDPISWEETWQGKLSERMYLIHQWLRKNLPFLEIPLNFAKRFLFFLYFFFHDLISPPPLSFFTAEEMTEKVKEAVSSKTEKPLFLWVHYMDAHTPYGMFLRNKSILGRIKYLFVNQLLDFLNEYPRLNRIFLPLYISLYDRSIKYTDNAIRDLFSHLRETGILSKDDVAIITSDHGEEFLEHGGVLHLQKLWNTHIHIPLLVVGPEKFIGKRRKLDIPRGSIDIAPTILDFAGARKPVSYLGENLFDPRERLVFSETSNHSGMLQNISLAARCVITDGYKLIDIKGKKSLFALSDEKEENNVYGEKTEIVKKLEKKLADFEKRS